MLHTFLLVCLFGQSESIQPRSVNLALDTILEFNNKETDLQIIDNVQKFLGKIKNVLKEKSGRRFMGKEFKFTDFLTDFFEMIRKYDDDDLDDVVTVIDDEIRKYHYAGCKFFELLQNNDMRKFVGRKLDQIKDKSPDDLRNDIGKVIGALKTEEEGIKEFLEYINSLYPKESKDKLKNFLNNIELYKSKSKRANLDLIKVIREGLRNAIFDHYTNLNVNARKDFKIRLETFWKNFIDPYKVGHKVWNIKYTNFDERNSERTTEMVSHVNRESNDLANSGRQENIDNIQFNTLKYFENTEVTKPTGTKEVKDSKELLRFEFPNVLKDTTSKNWQNDQFNTIKDIKSEINAVLDKEKTNSIDKSIYGHFVDTPKNVVKEFEKSIDLNLPDIPKMVKEKFDSITKDRLLKTKEETFKDINIDIDKSEDIKKPREKVKPKKKDKRKRKKPKRFSVVTEKTTDKFYDSEEIYNMHDRKTTDFIKKKSKHKSTKRKVKKDTKSTTKSRFITLYVEEYTGKVKKIKNRDRTGKHKYTQKEKTKKGRKKDKKGKTKRYRDVFADSDKYTKKTTKAKKYKDHRHEKPTKHHKKSKKYSKRPKTTKKSRKWFKSPPTVSYEGISIESFETKSFRKNIDFDDFQNMTVNTQSILTSTTNLVKSKSTTKEVSTFGTLDFWPGTNAEKLISQNIKNYTKSTENTTVASKSILSNFNSTFEKGKGARNETLRLIDVKEKDFEITTNLPNTTKNVTKFESKSSTMKSTNVSQKLKVTTKTKPPVLKRRSIGTPPKNKINTAKKTTIATKTTTISTSPKPTFNLGEYLNQSEILKIDNEEKKGKIQEKILRDMEAVFSPTTVTTLTTKVFTDPFNDIENALGI